MSEKNDNELSTKYFILILATLAVLLVNGIAFIQHAEILFTGLTKRLLQIEGMLAGAGGLFAIVTSLSEKVDRMKYDFDKKIERLNRAVLKTAPTILPILTGIIYYFIQEAVFNSLGMLERISYSIILTAYLWIVEQIISFDKIWAKIIGTLAIVLPFCFAWFVSDYTYEQVYGLLKQCTIQQIFLIGVCAFSIVLAVVLALYQQKLSVNG